VRPAEKIKVPVMLSAFTFPFKKTSLDVFDVMINGLNVFAFIEFIKHRLHLAKQKKKAFFVFIT
jgi:hypothetical protein